MRYAALPATAAWRHEDSRTGFEVVHLAEGPFGVRATGSTTAISDGGTWLVEYEIELDPDWVTRLVRLRTLTAQGPRERLLRSLGPGRWELDGAPAPEFDGLLDVDLESSALTNAFPVRRLAPGADEVEAPALWVRGAGLRVERLDQRYRRIGDGLYAYAAPAFDFHVEIRYDSSGLVETYPGIAARVA